MEIISSNTRLLRLLQTCSKLRSTKTTKPLHALTITLAPETYQPIFFSNNVMSFYVSTNELSTARKLFDNMPDRTVVSYNTIINGYSKHGNVFEAWGLFCEMRGFGFIPTQFTLSGLLSCGELDFCRGIQLHGVGVKSGLFSVDAFVGTALISFYGRFKCWNEVVRIFDDMPRKNLVTWNSVMCLFGQYGFVDDCLYFFRDLVRERICLSECSFVGVLSGLGCEQDLVLGEQIHALVIKFGFDYEALVVNSLINMYVKCAAPCLAEKVFEEAPVRDIVSWNTIVGALGKNGNPNRGVEYFLKMFADGLMPNQTTFICIMNCCIIMEILIYGKFVHAKIIKNGFESDVYVGSSLVDFYSKSDKLEDARRCHDEIHEKNEVSWNALILGYANKSSLIAVCVFLEMLRSSYQPNEFTFSAVLKSVSVFELKQLHGLIMRTGYQNNEYVLSSLITSYAKNGLVDDALTFIKAADMALSVVPLNNIAGTYNRVGRYRDTVKLLSQLEEPDIVSWNIVIAACARNGDFKEVLEIFKNMHKIRIHPDKYTFVSLLSMCSKISNLALGSSVHGLIIKTIMNSSDSFIWNLLIDMYGKCGDSESALKVFERVNDRNLITWTALISALGQNGHSHEAIHKFREMEILGIKPDGVAFLAVLSACRHGGLLSEAMDLFGEMNKKYTIEPAMDHYQCMVDMLAKTGHLDEAERLISSMHIPPNALIWRSFLEGCRRHRAVRD
ncbi:hypothetical protein ACFE04_016726 [Oxalis oulophora]